MLKLFRDIHGYMVQTSNPDSDPVELCAQGGGFVHRCPHQLFHETFEPCGMPEFKLSAVTADWLFESPVASIPAYLNGRRWNGWAVPYFTLENAMLVVQHSAGVLEWAGDAIRIVPDPNYCIEEAFVLAEVIFVDGQAVKVFQLCDGWCWDEV